MRTTRHRHRGFDVLQVPVLNDNYSYLIVPEQNSGNCWVIDPADASVIIDCCNELQRDITQVWNTHHHWDHTDGNAELIRRYGCKVLASVDELERIDGITLPLRDHQRIELDGLRVDVMALPGHTDGHLAYLVDDALFCGDVLFSAGCGRIFEGTPEQMWQSLQRLVALPSHYRVYCAHEYTLMNLDFACAVADSLADSEYRQICWHYLGEIRLLREQGLPSVPSTLADECTVNPFLQVLRPAFNAQYASSHGCEASAIAVFTHLRQWRNHFVPVSHAL